jgi:hypothetical protein
MTAPAAAATVPVVLPAPAHAARRRPRTSAWPYAGVVAGLASGVAGTMLVQGRGTFVDAPPVVTTEHVLQNLTSALSIKIGAGLNLLGLVAAFVFLLGLTRFVGTHAPRRAEALRWSSIAFVAAGSIGAVIRYIAGGGVPGGIDVAFYSPEAVATLAVLSDQLTSAAFLPGLAVMAVVGLAAVRERVLPRTVGVVTLVLAAGSVAATLVLGLPYSSSLVFPLFALAAGGAGVFSRRSA